MPQMPAGDVNRSPILAASEPKLPVRPSAGKVLVRACWMRRSDAASWASKRATSGRRSSNPDGSPGGSDGTLVTASIVCPRAISGMNTARGERPVSVASAASSCPMAFCVRAMSATTAERSASDCLRS